MVRFSALLCAAGVSIVTGISLMYLSGPAAFLASALSSLALIYLVQVPIPVVIAFELAFVLLGIIVPGARMASLETILLLITTIALIGLGSFVAIRHVQLRRSRTRHPLTLDQDQAASERSYVKDVSLYVLVVLGSGGHTKEMLLMMENEFPKAKNPFHRRYLVSSGDSMSLKHLEAFEKTTPSVAHHPGTYDIRIVTRARRVHQSLLTTPISAFRSIIDIFPVLLSPPKTDRVAALPDVIITNGPATGFFVALVAHFLKTFYLVPGDKMQVLFIESWARIKTLSLTGKLLHYTGISDTFLVQHDQVAKKYGVLNAGWLVLPASSRHTGIGVAK